MSSNEVKFDQAAYDAITAQVNSQADKVRKFKTEKAAKADIESAVEELKKLKTQQTKLQPPPVVNKEKQLRAGLEDLLIRRFFYVPAFEIYGNKTRTSWRNFHSHELFNQS
jgi:glycyl-tRNA synthetase